MINGAGPPAAGAAAFPDPPQGSPGEIVACARTLTSAADDLEHADGGLHGASSALEADWQGYAAAAYHSSSEGLASVARGGANTFRECAHAVAGYGTALDHAQSEIRRLRVLYEDALHRRAAAADLAGRLVGAVTPTTRPAEANRLQTQCTAADNQSRDAGIEADGYAHRATTVLAELKQIASRYEQALSGQQPGQPAGPFGSPFSATGHPGPGFGAPFTTFDLPGTGGFTPSGLSAYSGVIPVGDPWHSPIPGYGYHKDATTPEAVPNGDLTNVILAVAAPFAAGPADELGGALLRSLAESSGVGAAGRVAVASVQRKATQAAIDKMLASGEARSSSLAKGISGARAAGLRAAAEKQVAQREGQAQLADHVIEIANRTGKLPPGVRDILSEIVHRGPIYANQGLSRLIDLQATLNRAGTGASRAAARAIGAILRGAGL